VNWTDSSGNLWLFGGNGYDSIGSWGYLNDLWEYTLPTAANPAGTWTWMGGSSTVSSSSSSYSQPGVFGTEGVAASGNIPGGRAGAASWLDKSGNLWIYGGYSENSSSNEYSLGDLWEFNPSLPTYGQWAWMGDSTAINQSGAYATHGAASAGNLPGSRYDSNGWTDKSGNLWLFGGQGYDVNGLFGPLNDIWEFIPSANPAVTPGTWAWMGGSSVSYAPGVYGVVGTKTAGDTPGARYAANGWADSSGNFWLFAGDGVATSGNGYFGLLNDLWEYQPTATISTPVTPTITWATPAAITYGTALSATQLNASSTVAGSFAYYPTSGTVLTAGTQTLKVTFTPTDTTDYTTATATVPLTVNQATPTITWPSASAITYGQTLASSTLTGGASTPAGTFNWTTSTIAPAAGSQSESVTFTPSDTTDYSTVTGTVTVTVNQATPTVSAWPTASAITYGQTLASSTLSGGISTPAGSFTWSSSTTKPSAGSQSESVTFTPSNTAEYTPVTSTVSVQVNPATLTVTANNLSQVVGTANPAFAASYSGFVNGDTAAVLSGSPAFSTTATASSPVGLYPITIAQGTLTAANYTFTFVNGMLSVVAAPTVTLTTTAALSGSAGAGYTAVITVKNTGTGPANNVTLTAVSLGSAAPSTPSVPANLGTIASGGTGTVTFNFPASAGSDRAAVVVKYAGTDTGGSFSGSIRAVLP
jgi:hypothetical protein